MSKKTAKGGETSKTLRYGTPLLPHAMGIPDIQNFVPVIVQEHRPSSPPRAVTTVPTQQEPAQHQPGGSSAREKPRRDKSPAQDGPSSTHQVGVAISDDSDDDPRQAEIRAQNALLQRKDDLIRQLQRKLRRQQRENANPFARQPHREDGEVRIDSQRPRRDDEQRSLKKRAQEKQVAPPSLERPNVRGRSVARDEESSNSTRSRAKRKSEAALEIQDASQEWRDRSTCTLVERSSATWR